MGFVGSGIDLGLQSACSDFLDSLRQQQNAFFSIAVLGVKFLANYRAYQALSGEN
jgi:hypothetical protein